MEPENRSDINRRESIAWIARAGLIVGAGPALLSGCGDTGETDRAVPRIDAAGYGRDPNMLEPKRPWPLTLSEGQRNSLARLADMILPGDTHGPAPSTIGIADFFDEWLSAPYPDQDADRQVILPGLSALDRDSGSTFAAAASSRATMLVERLAQQASRDGKDFLSTVRRVCMLGYYTSAPGLADIGYVEPTPAKAFPGPPRAVLDRLGL